jgi:hypothetical protein
MLDEQIKLKIEADNNFECEGCGGIVENYFERFCEECQEEIIKLAE